MDNIEFKIDKRKDLGKRENNPGFRVCMHCGEELPPGEDGRPLWRKEPMACDVCVNAKKGRMVVDGREVEIPGGYGTPFLESVKK